MNTLTPEQLIRKIISLLISKGVEVDKYETDHAVTFVAQPTHSSYGRIYGKDGKTLFSLKRILSHLRDDRDRVMVLFLEDATETGDEEPLTPFDPTSIEQVACVLANLIYDEPTVRIIETAEDKIIVEIAAHDVKQQPLMVDIEKVLAAIAGSAGKRCRTSWIGL